MNEFTPIKIASTKGLNHDEFAALRKNGLGGSDAGAILGLNQYASAYTVYADKLNLSSSEKPTNEAMRLGNDLEDYVAQRYCEITGKQVRRDNYLYGLEEYPYIRANVDRVIVGENGGLECKTMSPYADYDFEAGECPPSYYAQCQHYMLVRNWDFVDLCVLQFQKGVFILHIERNDEFIETMLQKEIEFWTECVLKKCPPAPDGSEATREALKEIYPNDYADCNLEINEIDRLVLQMNLKKEQIDKLAEERQTIQNRLCKLLSENNTSTGHGEQYKASWKIQQSSRLDTARLKKDYPDIYERYINKTTTKVLRTGKFSQKKGA